VSRTRVLLGLLVAVAALALLLHALPLLLWRLHFERELADLAGSERLHTPLRGELPVAPAGWTELHVDNFALRAPLASNQLQRCVECGVRCLLRLEGAGSLAVLDSAADEDYEGALNVFAPDADDISLFHSVARNWDVIDALTNRARNSIQEPSSFRFETASAKGIVTEFHVDGVYRYVVYPYAPSGAPGRMFGLAGVAPAVLDAVLGSLSVGTSAPARFASCGAADANSSAAAARGTVILLHGLGRSSRSMRAIEAALDARGYRVINLDYPSRQHDIETLVGMLAAEIERCCRNGPAPVHFVTHSMGGILVRAYLARNRFPPLGRVVMLSPPNQGSELVDAFGDNPLYELILGPAAEELGTQGATSVPRALPPVDFELGVITGDKSLNPLGAWLIPGENDGTVSIESARVAGMQDFLVAPENHTFIMRSPEVIEQVIHFLEHGHFAPQHPD
jgi:triacylglycerol lipase